MTNSTYLSSVHINTLSKLHEIAKKHNCIINLEVRNEKVDDLEDILDLICNKNNEKITEKVKQIILENPEIVYSTECVVESFILTLRDRRKNKEIYNNHRYICIDGHILFNDDWDKIEMDEESQEFFDELYQYDYYGFNLTMNKYMGWEGLDTKSGDYNTYRNGMHIKFFGDLVCDYLGEERIEEVY